MNNSSSKKSVSESAISAVQNFWFSFYSCFLSDSLIGNWRRRRPTFGNDKTPEGRTPTDVSAPMSGRKLHILIIFSLRLSVFATTREATVLRKSTENNDVVLDVILYSTSVHTNEIRLFVAGSNFIKKNARKLQGLSKKLEWNSLWNVLHASSTRLFKT